MPTIIAAGPIPEHENKRENVGLILSRGCRDHLGFRGRYPEEIKIRMRF
ncbi:MAG: hypothetical protein KBF41_03475 [Azonexus sp.]|jgi:hypothetical protein|nr:hypothetical protein [Azonexus sp.]